MKKKTIKELHEMKNIQFFYAALENDYLTKSNWEYRIKKELSNWDKEAQQEILKNLSFIIESDQVMDFDENEIYLLLGE